VDPRICKGSSYRNPDALFLSQHCTFETSTPTVTSNRLAKKKYRNIDKTLEIIAIHSSKLPEGIELVVCNSKILRSKF
jgi:hypothetical protein